MRNRYIKFFKKELVVLLILLGVVCFSFGVTYANFVVKSDNYRAVEMFASKLSENIFINGELTNKYTVNPGNNVVNIDIKSLNNVDTYYKLLTKSDLKMFVSYGFASGTLERNETVGLKLYIINPSDEYLDIYFDVAEGYITNKLEDVIITEGYNEIKESINVGDTVTYNDKEYKILEIKDNGELTLLSNDTKKVTLSGYSSYNDLDNEVNNICEGRSVSLEDIMKYTNETYVEIEDYYTNLPGMNYYPHVFRNEDVVIDGDNDNNEYGYSYSISLKNRKLVSNNIKDTVFDNGEYLLYTRYYNINKDDKIDFYVMGVKNGTIILKKLYDSNNKNYEFSSNVRCIKTIQNEEISK